MWSKLIEFLINKLDIDRSVIEINDKTIMLNKVYPKAQHSFNLCILMAKQIIYASKCQGKSISMEQIITSYQFIDKVCNKNRKFVTHSSPMSHHTNLQEYITEYNDNAPMHRL